MQQIQVRLRKPTELGRLYYFHDEKLLRNVLYVRSSVERSCVYHVNVNNTALFDLDKNHLLTSAEFIYPKRAWQVKPLGQMPHPSVQADLEFEVSQEREFLEMAVEISTDEVRSYA